MPRTERQANRQTGMRWASAARIELEGLSRSLSKKVQSQLMNDLNCVDANDGDDQHERGVTRALDSERETIYSES